MLLVHQTIDEQNDLGNLFYNQLFICRVHNEVTANIIYKTSLLTWHCVELFQFFIHFVRVFLKNHWLDQNRIYLKWRKFSWLHFMMLMNLHFFRDTIFRFKVPTSAFYLGKSYWMSIMSLLRCPCNSNNKCNLKWKHVM